MANVRYRNILFQNQCGFFKLIGRKLKPVKESWGRKQLPIATVKFNRHTEAMLKFENE